MTPRTPRVGRLRCSHSRADLSLTRQLAAIVRNIPNLSSLASREFARPVSIPGGLFSS